MVRRDFFSLPCGGPPGPDAPAHLFSLALASDRQPNVPHQALNRLEVLEAEPQPASWEPDRPDTGPSDARNRLGQTSYRYEELSGTNPTVTRRYPTRRREAGWGLSCLFSRSCVTTGRSTRRWRWGEGPSRTRRRAG